MMYTLKNGAKIKTVNENDIDNAVIFKIQAFKKSGKYYADHNLVLDGYTKEEITRMQCQGDNTEKSFCYNLVQDLIDFLTNDRTFYKDMTLVVNCDEFFPFMIPAIDIEF